MPFRTHIGIFVAAVFCAALLSCGGKNTAEGSANPLTRQFPTVSAPTLMTGEEEILEYVTAHFWDAFADTSRAWLTDSLHIAGVDRDAFEQNIGMYSSLLSIVPLDRARAAVAGFCSSMELFEKQDTASKVFGESMALAKRYLFDPNSPARDEDIYGALAGRLAVSPYVPEELRPSYEYEARLCDLNRRGTSAADFSFVYADGRKGSLYGVKSSHVLLFFTNPGCPSCAEIIGRLQSSAKITGMVESGELAVVNIYIDDDLKAWRDYAGTYPSSWHTGYDGSHAIRDNLIYNVRAIPSLYVLDSDKKVVMKDAPEDKVFAYLENL